MLVNLHVKNFAIIDEIDVDFGEHLNILTGETGAGKSILVGSIGIALGARVSPEMIGKRADHAMVELVFHTERPETIDALKQLDIEPEDGQIVISRKITANRSINKINGESVSVSLIKKVSALCIDIHGQHEHQSLLHKEYHRNVVDRFAGEIAHSLKEEIAEQYEEYRSLVSKIEENGGSEQERARELSFLEYERKEIEDAKLEDGEEERLEDEVRKMSNASNIVESMGKIYECTGDSYEGCANKISQALRYLGDIADLDENLDAMQGELQDIENLLSDFNRTVADYMDDFVFDEAELRQKDERLNHIRGIQAKYGNSYEEVMRHYVEVIEKIDQLKDYENYCKQWKAQKEQCEKNLSGLCKKLTKIRKEAAVKLEQSITETLQELNFEQARFAVTVKELSDFTIHGKDDVEFLIATNPGAELNALNKIASGGELSRIMLAIKTVFADVDQIETLIFDEIDVGISGRTAQKVSEKMSILGKNHQIICITHLPQIAAMADTHFVIEKISSAEQSETRIRPLSGEQSTEELARMLGGVEITQTVLTNAKEMKELAKKQKDYS